MCIQGDGEKSLWGGDGQDSGSSLSGISELRALSMLER